MDIKDAPTGTKVVYSDDTAEGIVIRKEDFVCGDYPQSIDPIAWGLGRRAVVMVREGWRWGDGHRPYFRWLGSSWRLHTDEKCPMCDGMNITWPNSRTVQCEDCNWQWVFVPKF